MLGDARKQAKNQFSRFTIFVNKGSEGVRETQVPRVVFQATSRTLNKQSTDTGAQSLDAQFVVKLTLSLSWTTVYVDPVIFCRLVLFLFSLTFQHRSKQFLSF